MADAIAAKSDTLRGLSQWLAERHDWPLKERLALIQRLARQVQTLHQNGRIHREIGVDVITVDEQLRPQLPPPATPRRFGGDDSDPEFCPPELAGGVGVTLPEQIDAAAQALQAAGYALDPRRIDVYQLGVLLCRFVTGESILSYIYDATIKGRVPALARPLLERTLGVDSPERFENCDGLIEALDEALRKTELMEAPTSTHETPALGSVILLDGDTPPLGTLRTSEPPAAQELPFERLGHYRILEQIGSGGMGDVYRGYDESLDRPVAVKVLPPQLARDTDFVRRFHAEATAAASLAHPNVVPIYFIGEDAGHHFFAMQYVVGESLAERLSRQGRLPVDEALELVEQCLAGLQAAHARGLIHRDVKPGNILIERETGRAMLVDFGLVRRLDGSAPMTATGVIMGTVDYIAPEQARGGKVDARADIYSLGVLFYQLLSGHLPFLAESPTAMVFQHAYEPPFPLEQSAPDAPPAMVQIVGRMMAKDPDDRHPDCRAVLADLQAFREGLAVGVAVKLPPQQEAFRQGNLPSPFGRGAGHESLPSPFGRGAGHESLPSPFGRGAGGEGGEADDSPFAAELSLLPPDTPWQRMHDWAATMFRRCAPEQIQELQGTTQQMDAAVAHYQRRRNRLAKLLEEARGLESELPQEQVEDLQRQLNVADATLARLCSQQNVLKARLQAAEAQRQLEGGLPQPKRRRWLVPMVVGTGVLALVSLLLILQPARVTKKASPTPVPLSVAKWDLEGEFDAVRPGGVQRRLQILGLGKNRYQITKGGVFSGVYELRGDTLLVVEPDDKRLTEFVWLVKDSDHLVLIVSPLVTGTDYRGVTLTRAASIVPATIPVPLTPPPPPMVPTPKTVSTAATTHGGGVLVANDIFLDESQRLYRDWTEETYSGMFISPSEWEGIGPPDNAAKEQRWIRQLSTLQGSDVIPCINALAAHRNREAVPALLKIASERREKDNRDRWMATRALGLIGDRSVVPELIDLTYHYNQNTRFWAQISLVRVTGKNFGRDASAWKRWWNQQGVTPPASYEPVVWTTRSEWADPARQAEADRQFVQIMSGSFAPASIIGGSVRRSPPQVMPDSYIFIGTSEISEKGFPFRVVSNKNCVPELLVVPVSYEARAGDSAVFSIWSDVSGQPGIKLATFTVLDITTDVRLCAAARSSAPCQLQGGATYWLIASSPRGVLRWSFDRSVYRVIEAHRKDAGDWVVRPSGNMSAFVIYGSAVPEPSAAPVPKTNSTDYTFDFHCEGGASALAALKLKGIHNTVLRNWQVQIPATFSLPASDWTPDEYNLYVSASGYVSQVINTRFPRRDTASSVRDVTLYRKRYVVLRYACNHDGSRDLSPEKTEQGRVAVSHWGQIPDLRGDWQIWQKGKDLYFESHRYFSTNFGFAKAPAGETFDALQLAPENDRYASNNMRVTPGEILFTRIAGNSASEQCYAKLEIEEITERPPSHVEVIEGPE